VKFDFPDPLSAKDVSRLDQNSAALGIPTGYLMECAGSHAAAALVQKYALQPPDEILIVCGTGNNGGDGFVITRHLGARGFRINLIVVGSPANIRTEEARTAWIILQRLPLNIRIQICTDSTDLSTVPVQWKTPKLVVDCILGTGVAGKLRQPVSAAIDFINSLNCPILSIDVPSGMNPDTGEIPDKAVHCSALFTFHRPKIGLSAVPDQLVIPIGIPPEAHLFIGEGDLRTLFPSRKSTNHKGEFGKLLVIGGSYQYSGAPALAAMAGLEIGLDLCIALVPASIAPTLRTYSPNLIVRSGSGDNLALDDLKLAQELTQWADAVVIGPGMGLADGTRMFFESYFEWVVTQPQPLVVDADGLKFLGNYLQQKKHKIIKENIVLTPHSGEFTSLIGEMVLPPLDDYFTRGNYLIEKIAQIGGATLLLKGKFDYIVNSHQFRVNLTGCPEMAVGGTGDVLAGLTGALLALRLYPFSAAALAAYINGKIGENARDTYGHRISALDLIHQIRPFFQKIGV
jgi:NAD(P)H-hydrate epimerase